MEDPLLKYLEIQASRLEAENELLLKVMKYKNINDLVIFLHEETMRISEEVLRVKRDVDRIIKPNSSNNSNGAIATSAQ